MSHLTDAEGIALLIFVACIFFIFGYSAGRG